MRFFESLAIGVAMYSKIPMPRVEWNEKNMKYAMCFFPLVGVVTGILAVSYTHLDVYKRQEYERSLLYHPEFTTEFRQGKQEEQADE